MWLGTDALKQLLNPVYNIVFGVSPAVVGTVFMICRMWDATIDAFIGTVSDNFRSRWGRPRPFIFAGAVLSGITFPLHLVRADGIEHNVRSRIFSGQRVAVLYGVRGVLRPLLLPSNT
jgi:Na+/melibiose symporter-like transporter